MSKQRCPLATQKPSPQVWAPALSSPPSPAPSISEASPLLEWGWGWGRHQRPTLCGTTAHPSPFPKEQGPWGQGQGKHLPSRQSRTERVNSAVFISAPLSETHSPVPEGLPGWPIVWQCLPLGREVPWSGKREAGWQWEAGPAPPQAASLGAKGHGS